MDLDALKHMGCDALDELFESAAAPSLDEMNGEYDGALLTGNLPPAPRHFPITAVNRPWLPWKGKVFYPAEGSRGRGANRIAAGPLRREMWSFETSIGASRIDGRDALLIDYDLPGNPFWLKRAVFDELRRLRDGLYLGKGGVVALGQTRFVFIWALQPAA